MAFLGLACLHGSMAAAQSAATGEPSSDPRPVEVGPETDFRIGPGDLLSVDVFGLEDLDREVRVLSDGTISLPFLGTFRVADLTLSQAERQIEGMLSDRRLVREPEVSIFVEEFRSRSVSVQGAVVKPGVYQLLGEKSLLDVLGEAGGIGERGGRTIFVLRKDSEGREQWIEIDSERLTDAGDLSLDIALQPGDVVMVPHTRRLRVYVSGAVEKPGPIEFSSGEGITVLQAIAAAGGPTARANLGKTHVIRRLPDGAQERIDVNIKRIRKGKDEDFVLEKNDVVMVGEWFF